MAISELLGKILKKVDVDAYKTQIEFETECGKKFLMTYHQDCCESVSIKQIDGDLEDLIGSPIVMAEERSSKEEEQPLRDAPVDYSCYEAYSWTFYKLATLKGYVGISWFGSSNGYYSTSVDFQQIL
ncbi:MAG: hypothetical protein HC875_20715 [Anaerolineales bacterium]|nr:hypothetical protein [Anaerolineales bacterium]